MSVINNQFATLSDNQLEQAWSIAQYDVKAAARYCKTASARNQMKCSLCGSELVKSSGKVWNFVCPHYRRGKYD